MKVTENLMPRLTLVIGGAASGKSSQAERMATDSGRPRVYIATAQAFDDEMRAKIAAHKKMRGDGWVTIEEPFDLPSALAGLTAAQIVLIDCATLWLTNHILMDADIDAMTDALLAGLRDCRAPVVIVSNEVGAGIVPDNALSRRFRNAQGRLNQRLAAQADRVVTVIAGLPLTLKDKRT